ncbi:MAG TPA: helix-turn-helix domain-containing protein [Anaerolineaceae bacterium]|nr:helix-turn-helix domain-containing protein [Anaerolineaceae bacterium]HPN53304.1 helix-turn-helix domain-containing protein [Anaerolineaceae bacterium]
MENLTPSATLYRARTETAVTYIAGHLDTDLNLENVAAAAGFSPYHFHRIFTSVTGETPHDFILRLRLEHAANLLLKAPGLSITDIACQCGFSSPSTFARAFKGYFGASASAFRGRKNWPAAPAVEMPAASQPSPFDPNTVKITTCPALHVAYIANLEGYSLEKICKAWGRLWKWAQARGWARPETLALGVSYDDPRITPQEKCRYYACLTVPEAVHPDRHISVMDLPAGRYAVFTVECRADEIQHVYHDFFRTWLLDSSCQPGNAPIYEIYLATPENHPRQLYCIEIRCPILPL